MKVRFLKTHSMGSNSFDKGQTALIITSIAEELIEEGICEENKSVTLRDTIIEESAEIVAQRIIDGLPDHASDIVKEIASMTSKLVLEHLSTDDRSTVSTAADNRIEELN